MLLFLNIYVRGDGYHFDLVFKLFNFMIILEVSAVSHTEGFLSSVLFLVI